MVSKNCMNIPSILSSALGGGIVGTIYCVGIGMFAPAEDFHAFINLGCVCGFYSGLAGAIVSHKIQH